MTAAHQANAQGQQLLDDLLAAIGSVDALNAQIATLNASLAAAQTKATADAATIAGLTAQIATFKTQVATLNTKITTLNKQITTLKAQAAADAATIAGLKTQGATDAATIAGLKTQVSADGVTIAGLQAQLAAIPACPPVVICPVCPAPIVCPAPPAPPVVTPPPPAVSGSVTLSWDAVVGATGYRVYYGPAPRTYTQPKGQGLSTTGTSYTVPGLVVLARYYFAVTAQNDVAESDYSNEVFADIRVPPLVGPDTQAPTVPTGFAAVAVSPTQIDLSWNPSIDNVGTTGYYIYKGDGSTLVILKLVNSYSHTGLAPGTTYVYRISAFDAVPNHSPWTDPPVSVTTPGQ